MYEGFCATVQIHSHKLRLVKDAVIYCAYMYLVVNDPSVQSLATHTHTRGHPAETCFKRCKEQCNHKPYGSLWTA